MAVAAFVSLVGCVLAALINMAFTVLVERNRAAAVCALLPVPSSLAVSVSKARFDAEAEIAAFLAEGKE